MIARVTMHEFASEFGREAAIKAGKLWNGRRQTYSDKPGAIEFPDMEAKRKRFNELLSEGRTFREIAESYNLSIKYVQRIVNGK